MPVRWLKPSPVLVVERFTDFDEFRPNFVIGGGTSVPFQPKEFSAFRAILPLQDCLLVLQRSFARYVEADMGVDHSAGLVVPLGFHAKINGHEFDNSMIALMRDKTPIRAVEQHPNTYLMLRFNSKMMNRGWADFDSGLTISRALPERMERLRALILDMFSLASDCTDPRELENLNRSIQETLIAGLDSLLVLDDVKRARPGSFDKHRRLVDQLDELVSSRPDFPPYSEDLARCLGISVRTLQTCVQVVHGMSLHRYLRVKRLWSVRKVLATGYPALTVKAAAKANGFWHMGEFSYAYKAAFGEMPSETLARARYV